MSLSFPSGLGVDLGASEGAALASVSWSCWRDVWCKGPPFMDILGISENYASPFGLQKQHPIPNLRLSIFPTTCCTQQSAMFECSRGWGEP